MNRRWRRIGLVVLCVVGTDLLSAQLPGAFWFEAEQLFIVGIASARESAGAVGRLTLGPVGPAVLDVDGRASELVLLRPPPPPVLALELRSGARPLRLPLERVAATPTAALDDH